MHCFFATGVIGEAASPPGGVGRCPGGGGGKAPDFFVCIKHDKSVIFWVNKG